MALPRCLPSLDVRASTETEEPIARGSASGEPSLRQSRAISAWPARHQSVRRRCQGFCVAQFRNSQPAQ